MPLHIFKVNNIYFASKDKSNPTPQLYTLKKCSRSPEDIRFLSQYEGQFEFVDTVNVDNMIEAKRIIDDRYYPKIVPVKTQLSESQTENGQLKIENKHLKHELTLLKLEHEKLNKKFLKLQKKYDTKLDGAQISNKKYYEKNKELIPCDCGAKVTNLNFKRHLDTSKHKKWLNCQ